YRTVLVGSGGVPRSGIRAWPREDPRPTRSPESFRGCATLFGREQIAVGNLVRQIGQFRFAAVGEDDDGELFFREAGDAGSEALFVGQRTVHLERLKDVPLEELSEGVAGTDFHNQ